MEMTGLWRAVRGVPLARFGCVVLLVASVACAESRSIVAGPGPSATGVAQAEGGRDPLRPRITVRQIGSAYAGGVARFEVVSENFVGGGISRIVYGDGSVGHESQGYDMGCGGPRPGTGPSREVLEHVYRYPGQWTVTSTFIPTCHDQELPQYEGSGVITVQPGRVLSNGPYQPLTPVGGGSPFLCGKSDRPYGEPEAPRRTMECFPHWGDEDGYVTKVVLRWGDGSRDTVFRYPLSKCVDPPDYWPATYVDEDEPPWGVEHRYPKVGKYRAYVTVTSSGCDGKDVQTRTESTRVVVE